MIYTKRIEKLERKFIDYSDKAHDFVFFIRDGLTKNMHQEFGKRIQNHD